MLNAAAVLSLAGAASAWYLPGMAPTDYSENDKIPVLVNRLTSVAYPRGQQSVLGYDYYHPRFRFCEPEGGKQSKGGSLGAILFGDRIYTSPIELEMLKEEECKYICTTEYSTQDAEFLNHKVARSYFQHWLVDGIPIVGLNADNEPISDTGFPLGEQVDTQQETFDEFAINNHYELVIQYHHNQAAGKYRVVGATIKASSRDTPHEAEGFKCDVSTDGPDHGRAVLKTDFSDSVKMSFSYSVKWEASETPWATRWDHYLQANEPKINWLALINTTLLVIFLGAFCALTVTRMVRKDIANMNNVDLGSEDIPDEVGWKLVAGDVFRAPSSPQAYALAVGSGSQILLTVFITLTLAALGFLSPANRGSFSTALLLLNTVLGGVGGYMSAVTYKLFGGTNWKLNLLLTPLVIPAMVFGLFFCINLSLVLSEASGAVPIGSMLAVLFIWAGIAVPLSLVCGFFGFKKPLRFPPNMRINQIPRQIPPQPWYHRLWAMMLIGGIIPFLAVSLQLRYILSAIWFQRIYYMFGFLFVTIWAMVMLSAASSTLAVYFSLVTENYHWQWRSLCVAGSPAIYVFLYACYYLVFSMSLTSFSGKLLYLSYSLLMSMLCFLALGSVGSVVAYFLVRRVYDSIKLD